MEKKAIKATLKAEKSSTGKDEAGKRTITLPEKLDELGAWAAEAKKESEARNMNFDLLQIVRRSYTMFHQSDMQNKLRTKLGKKSMRSTKVEDLGDVAEV